jgi:hypothetical protein
MASESFFSAPRYRSGTVLRCPSPVASHFSHRLLFRSAFLHVCTRPTSRFAPLSARPGRHSIACAARLRRTLAVAVSAKSLVGLSHQLSARQAWPFGFAHRVASASSRRSRLSRLHCAARANHSFQGTVGKRSLPIPSALLASAAVTDRHKGAGDDRRNGAT